MTKKTCELCGRQSDHTEKSLILVSPNKLQDYELCDCCINMINKSSEKEEIDFVSRIKRREGRENDINDIR